MTKPISFKEFNQQNPIPPFMELMHEQACREQHHIIMEKLSGNELIAYERKLMLEKADSYIFSECFIRDDSFPNNRVRLNEVRNMALNASSGTSDMSARLVVFNALTELHEALKHKSTRAVAAAYGAKKFLTALRNLSSIQNMTKELIRMNKRDDQKNAAVVAKIRKAKNKGDLDGLLQIISGVLAFQLSGSIKDVG